MDTMLVMLVAAFFASMGLVALLRPARVLSFFGTPELTRDGRNEVRAVYGGFGLAVAGLLLATFFIPGLRHGVIVTVAVSLVGMAMGRLVAAVIDGWPGFYPSLFLGVELLLAGMLLAAV
jgi:hypothetical protein